MWLKGSREFGGKHTFLSPSLSREDPNAVTPGDPATRLSEEQALSSDLEALWGLEDLVGRLADTDWHSSPMVMITEAAQISLLISR